MTAIIERMPLQPLPMSQTQRQSRRHSARLQENDASHSELHEPAREAQSSKTNAKKRKTVYEEDDDGFAFSRVKKKKSKDAPKPAPIPEEEHVSNEPLRQQAALQSAQTLPAPAVQEQSGESAPEPAKKRQKKKMSFSTPDASDKQPVRRSKRLSDENQATDSQHRTRRKADEEPPRATNEQSKDHTPLRVPKSRKVDKQQEQKTEAQGEPREEEPENERHSATKIALPFADTPVIKRNKEMRENKGKKGERRSSLSMRGRRASSLIETGNSNALPHDEVEVTDFYKHIESEGLPEPRRMRQLLTWCTTRSLDQKPMGASFEESSAIAAARVIEDELLKDLANKSELSDWFSREDLPTALKQLPERPNPRNIQNTEKIAELELQIEKLKLERDALEQLLRPPSEAELPKATIVDVSLLSPEEAAVFEQLQAPTSTSNIPSRLNSIFDQLQPTVDSFADSVHKIAQYQKAGDSVASRVLSIAAEKLAEREEESRRRAQPQNAPRSPRTDLGSVLRGLSRADQ